MRNISFFETQEQIKNQSKTVTRRLGWQFLKPGDLLCAVKKSQGLKRGEKVERLAIIRVLSVRRERLYKMPITDLPKEGFPDWSLNQFFALFQKINKIRTSDEVTRIEFEYVNE